MSATRASYVRRLGSFFVLALALAGATVAAKKDALPWAFRGEPGNGYRIDFVSVDPEPGTTLHVGAHVTLHVALKYTLQVADKGAVVMLFEDGKDRPLKDVPQVVQAVTRGEGELTLTGELTIPKGLKELRVFVPIMPEGIQNTSGELTIRYPVE